MGGILSRYKSASQCNGLHSTTSYPRSYVRGDLGIIFEYEGQLLGTTRGSFVSSSSELLGEMLPLVQDAWIGQHKLPKDNSARYHSRRSAYRSIDWLSGRFGFRRDHNLGPCARGAHTRTRRRCSGCHGAVRGKGHPLPGSAEPCNSILARTQV